MFDPENPPELAVTRWLNASEQLSLARLRDRVVVVLAFQMLCPGCVEHAIPQTKRLRARFIDLEQSRVAVEAVHAIVTVEAAALRRAAASALTLPSVGHPGLRHL